MPALEVNMGNGPNRSKSETNLLGQFNALNVVSEESKTNESYTLIQTIFSRLKLRKMLAKANRNVKAS